MKRITPGQFADSLALNAARGLTRRRVLRNAGSTAIGAALSTAYLGSGPEGTAFAMGTPTSPCGPSPLCPSGVCNGSGGCSCYGRVYATYTCNPGGGSGCWTEDYRSRGGHLWKCCDCCCLSGGGNSCSGCFNHNACICRVQL